VFTPRKSLFFPKGETEGGIKFHLFPTLLVKPGPGQLHGLPAREKRLNFTRAGADRQMSPKPKKLQA